ncbi:hypothetical protein PAE9249_05123 [Paenibacillus sp. CECT 9249]|uniref:SPRY domain-containing protein n=1 Tax=Paenibacillus sp. CECT 9249 TaxID=2845385 RepID=UPI001E5E18C5|nr:SPRY domain-containing protein [Paenibacillus sp. CECT 9249]CAH0122551.1 hypothetical protein PAE9249_05123 [Paenibacillus sp. CECT 9249]
MPLVTWDTINKGSSVVLTNGNLTATVPHRQLARASLGRVSGKWYFEISVIASGEIFVGIVDETAPIVNSLVSGTNYLRFYYAFNGNKYPESTSFGSSYTKDDIVSVLLDLDNGKLEFWKNGESQGVSHSNVKNMSGYVFPALNFGSPSGNAIATANFGATSFHYEIPKGYFSYDGSQYSGEYKLLILSDKGYHSFNQNDLLTVTTSEPTEQDFLNYGMNKSSVIDLNLEINQRSFVQNKSDVFGPGKVFKQTIDISKIPINKVFIK